MSIKETTEEKTPDTLQVYEVGYLLSPSLSETDVAATLGDIKKLVEDRGGVHISEEAPKMRQLAYTIVKAYAGVNHRYSTGYFGWIKFEMERQGLVSLEKELSARIDVVRFLAIKTVRESTLVYQRPSFTPRVDGERVKREVPHVQEGAVPSIVSEDELNKSIEKLIVE
jgi:ribosomal protein S6